MGQEANPAPEHTPTKPENVDELLEAARYDDIDDVISLTSSGIPLDSKDSQGRFTRPNSVSRTYHLYLGTALHMAAANGHLGIVEFLISRGVDVNASNEEKNTSLHWACLNGHIEVVKKLILAGANVSILNSHEQTPIDEAVSRGKMDVIDTINATMAQVELSGVAVS
ncbi:hypothetical protein LWI28_014642 [Acer negundo]|uniref:Uncharacterized protein n=1 Tax=Acer negundo TaxID=4023 RepID=A0AAD5P1S9_ACENE|nr:hypothetical protein LWI28_014642 [Acer negundo]